MLTTVKELLITSTASSLLSLEKLGIGKFRSFVVRRGHLFLYLLLYSTADYSVYSTEKLLIFIF